MKNKKIYAKDNDRINEYNIYVYDKYLKQLYNNAVNDNYLKLAELINVIITSNNKLELSSAINGLIDYYPISILDRIIKDEVLYCIIKTSKVKGINIKRVLLNIQYKFELNTSYYDFDDDVVFSENINSIPYVNSLRSKNN